MTPADSVLTRWSGLIWSARRRRLAAAIDTYRIELSRYPPPAPSQPPWLATALQLTDQAARALARGCVDEGWHMMFAALRQEATGLSAEALRARAVALRSEATSGKLKPWRADAIAALLPADRNGEVTADALVAATELRDEHFENEYRKLGYVRTHLVTVAGVVAGALASLWWLVTHGPPPACVGEPCGRIQIAYVLLFGLLGGALSAARPIGKQDDRSRIPEMLSRWSVTLVRPVLGAASALVVVMFLDAKLLTVPLDGVNREAAVLSVAFAAGFSERLILRALAPLLGEDGPRKDATTPATPEKRSSGGKGS